MYREWLWVRPMLSLGLCLTVARGLDPVVLADRLGLGAEREMLGRSEAVEEFGVTEPVARIGVRAGCAFAFQEYGAEVGMPDALRAASVGTDAVSVFRTASALSWFGYARGGQIAVSFELDSPHRRSGASPDDLIGLMNDVGIPTDRAWPVESPVAPILPGLALLTAVTDLRLSEADIECPLLTGEVVG